MRYRVGLTDVAPGDVGAAHRKYRCGLWHCIPAAAVDAPHFRDRLWIVAYPNGSTPVSVVPTIKMADNGSMRNVQASGSSYEAMAA